MRLATLPAAVAPVLVGIAVAIRIDGFALGPALAAMLGALALQVGANFANDAFDFKKGADTPDRVGPPRATQMGLLTARQVFTGMVVAFAVATFAGVYLTAVAGWPVIAIGVASIIAAVIYTGGPWPIGYHALGDVFTFVFFGLVAVAGTVYVQAQTLPALALIAGAAMGCTVTMILVVNNLRDIPTDSKTGKTTLGVLLGDPGTRVWYGLLAIFAFAFVFVAIPDSSRNVMVVLLSVPFLWPPLKAVRAGVRGAALNPVLKATARWHLVFGLLLSLGLLRT